MATVTFWLTVIKALATILPLIMQAVRDGKVRAATMQELVNAIILVHHTRVEAAKRARAGVDLDSGDLSDDPHNRDNSGPDGRADG